MGGGREITATVAEPVAEAAGLARRFAYASPSQNPLCVYAARLPRSAESIWSSARVLAALLVPGVEPDAVPWHLLRYPITAALRARLAETYAPASANRHLSVLRGVLKEAWRLEQMTTDDYHRARDVGPVRGKRLPPGRMIETPELAALFDACEAGTARGARDRLWLAVLMAGLRASETVTLNLGDVSPTGALRVLGKGNKQRRAWLSADALPALAAWLRVRRGGGSAEPLFVRALPSGALRGTRTRMARASVAYVLAKLCGEAGVGRHTPHNARRTLISELLERGVDIVTVMRIVGHERADTTAGYDRRPEAAAEKAARAFRVPVAGNTEG